MKKILALLVFGAMFLYGTLVFATSTGSCTQAYTFLGTPNFKVLTLTCTADASDGSFPTITVDSKSSGWYLAEVRTNPGSTAPTAAYDIVLNDGDGIDIMGNTLADRSATVSERVLPLLATSTYGKTLIGDALYMVVTNQSVHSATFTLKLFLVRP